MQIGIMTGGGDCPGLNAVVRGVVLRCDVRWGEEVLGFRDGWRGLMEDEAEVVPVDRAQRILARGGTILGTSRMQPFMTPQGPERVMANLAKRKIDALIVVGGEGTLGAARDMYNYYEAPVVGVPKTIDNDIGGTQLTFGFQTAVQIATDAIDRLHTTAESHSRVMVVEVMGRHAGHIALWAGIAGGAAAILVPEKPFNIEEVAERLHPRHQRLGNHSVVVVAEGAHPVPGTLEEPDPTYDEFGHVRLGGIGSIVARELEQRLGIDARVTVLGHVQRGGTPTAFDRVLCTSYGVAAVNAVHEGKFGTMVGIIDGRLGLVDLDEATDALKPIPEELWDLAESCHE